MRRSLVLVLTLLLSLAGCGSDGRAVSNPTRSSTPNDRALAATATARLQTSAPAPVATQPATPRPTATRLPEATQIVMDRAFQLLWTINGKALSREEIEACLQAELCITEHDSSSTQAREIAQLYGLIPEEEKYGGVHIQLLKGQTIALSLVGTGWMESQQSVRFEGNRYYWVINPCSTNKRVLIDALTGEQVGPVHEFVICTPAEPPMPRP